VDSHRAVCSALRLSGPQLNVDIGNDLAALGQEPASKVRDLRPHQTRLNQNLSGCFQEPNLSGRGRALLLLDFVSVPGADSVVSRNVVYSFARLFPGFVDCDRSGSTTGTMPMVSAFLKGANSGAWLSLGTLGTLWVVSSAFDELIEALDAAYDVAGQRPFWKTRLLAVGLAALTAFFLSCGIATMILGPRLGDWPGRQIVSFSGFCSALAIHSLDTGCRFRGTGSRDDLFTCT